MIPTRDPAAVRFGPFLYEPMNGRLLRADTELGVPPRALAILGCLIERPGLLVTKQHLLDQVWKDAFVTDTSLSEAVSVLRQALGDDAQEPSYVQTVPRRGYRFIAEVEPAAVASVEATVASTTDAGASADAGSRNAALWTPWLPWLACFVGGLAVGILSLALQSGPRVEDAPLARFTVPLPEGLALSGPSSLALSGNGRLLTALLEDDEGRRTVHARPLETGAFQPIAGSDGARFAFVSPDGERVGMWIADRIRAVHLRTGTWTTLGTARLLRGASWLEDGSLWMASEADGALRRVGPRGGVPLVVVRPRRELGEAALDAPIGIGGAGLVFTASRPGQNPLLYGWPASASTPRLLGAGTAPQWVAPAHVVFRRGDQTQAALLLPPEWTLLRPTTLARVGRTDANAPFAATSETMVRAPACRDCDVPRVATGDGNIAPVAVPGAQIEWWQLAADGRHLVAISRLGEDRQVWKVDLADGTPTLLDRGNVAAVALDGSATQVVGASHGSDGWTVRTLGPATTAATPLHVDAVPVAPTSVGAGGVVWMHKPNARGDLDVWTVAPGQAARPAVATAHNEWQARLSPDARHLAYLTDARGDVEIAVRDLTTGATVGTWPGADARWSPDGTRLLVRQGRHWQALALQPLQQGLHAVELPVGLPLPASPPPATTLDVVLQWAREVRQQVPVAPRPLPVVR